MNLWRRLARRLLGKDRTQPVPPPAPEPTRRPPPVTPRAPRPRPPSPEPQAPRTSFIEHEVPYAYVFEGAKPDGFEEYYSPRRFVVQDLGSANSYLSDVMRSSGMNPRNYQIIYWRYASRSDPNRFAYQVWVAIQSDGIPDELYQRLDRRLVRTYDYSRVGELPYA